MEMPEKSVAKKGGSGEAMVENKKQLIEIVEDLERDNLVMYDPNGGTVIMI